MHFGTRVFMRGHVPGILMVTFAKRAKEHVFGMFGMYY
jgi:hypothetical protein